MSRSAQPPRAVLFTPGLHEIGGAARRSRLFGEGLADRGWEVRVITRSATDRRFRLRRHGRITALEVPGFHRRRLGALLYLLCATPLGIVWGRRSSTFLAIQLTSPAVAASISSAVWRKSYLAFTSTTGELSEVNAVASGWSRLLRTALLRRATYLVAQTPEAALELREITTPEHIAVLPTPVRNIDAAPLNGEHRVAFVGRFSREKDLLSLLEAWHVLVKGLPEATLTLIGEGDAYRSVEPELRALVRTDPLLSTSVHFTGWVKDPVEQLREIDVFVLPSVSEGMSNALLEACAAGRIVVVSDIPGNRNVVGAAYPLLFPAGDSAAMADALLRALTDQGVRADAAARVHASIDRFAVEAVIDRLLSLIGSAERR